ncbi:MBL fold metallo-hydrolase [Streptomyces orinoci]|uniref:MBL fold metallo-hydrolase n=1 Tax=Streptomyces orinoci TaxID=67339 RepID=A0ABV3JQH3_STRON|nr:MBL fold metallo-hydrolase [Streptomyces orinoci]
MASAALGTGLAATAHPAAASPANSRRSPDGLKLRWLGVAGWELSFGEHSILVDPYLSRQEYRRADGTTNPAMPLKPNPGIVETVARHHLTKAPDLVLVTHGHWDHLLDVPQLLGRGGWKDATIRTLCGETHLYLLQAMDTDPARLEHCITVTGGEVLRFPEGSSAQPPACTVEVFRSLHSQLPGYGFPYHGHLIARPERPTQLQHLLEGGTLGYQVTVGANGPRVMFLSGTANFAEREVAGARPDVLVLGVSGHTGVHRHIERAMEALGNPPVVVPSHHDNMLTELTSPDIAKSINQDAVRDLRRIVEPLGATVLEPRHLAQLAL